eukprot:TRINITY_DN65648_c0_g1_i1.p1 TRINITY_DN65648_c0_g1~~TRINITY_DN65648_c0_g1_i1.p1  ORF type:complete len:196 (+),score=47.87 TRINITY_DN65648_c0_g1_i1:84-590(+)
MAVSPASDLDDPHELRRFTERQAENGNFQQALREVRAGRKRTHWMWFVVPTPPFLVDGEERGSPANRRYAIRSDEEGAAFLAFRSDGVDLRQNYLQIMNAIRQQLEDGKTALQLLGDADVEKLRSSAGFFQEIAEEEGDDEVAEVCEAVLERMDDGDSSGACPACTLQ